MNIIDYYIFIYLYILFISLCMLVVVLSGHITAITAELVVIWYSSPPDVDWVEMGNVAMIGYLVAFCTPRL